MKEKCWQCRFWHPPGEHLGYRHENGGPDECRRHAPITALSTTGFSGQFYSGTQWPKTNGRDGCGDFQPFEGEITKP